MAVLDGPSANGGGVKVFDQWSEIDRRFSVICFLAVAEVADDIAKIGQSLLCQL
jgi:hypothetical protein